MKKTILLTILFTSFLFSDTVEEIQKQNEKKAAQKKRFEKLVENNENLMKGKNFDDILKKSKDYSIRQKKKISVKELIISKKMKILIKLNQLELNSINDKDYEQLKKYNVLNLCLLKSNTFNDMDNCKTKFQESN